ncbi:hypothetical protein GCM10022226_61520 [Sphaerisporangium flaviroseum]|uniref:Sensor domain-containing protein n=1 Tax=Sphaerisporangium flaviroseum TaxID=509199 RepID=A0ABP7J2A2_9ACTN
MNRTRDIGKGRMSRWSTNAVTKVVAVAVTAALTGCLAANQPAVPRVSATTQVTVSAAAASPAPPTAASVEASFATAATVGLPGARSTTIPARGTSGEILICAPLTPLHGVARVQVPRRYATAGRELIVPGTGVFTQQGWILPDTAHATTLMRRITTRLNRCRYSGTADDPVTPAKKIRATSTTAAYATDSAGWRGHTIGQAVWVANKRTSVNVRVLVQRGPVLLALESIDYTTGKTEQALIESNFGRIVAVLTDTR